MTEAIELLQAQRLVFSDFQQSKGALVLSKVLGATRRREAGTFARASHPPLGVNEAGELVHSRTPWAMGARQPPGPRPTRHDPRAVLQGRPWKKPTLRLHACSGSHLVEGVLPVLVFLESSTKIIEDHLKIIERSV